MLRTGYAHNSPILFTTLGPNKREFCDLFDACNNGFQTPCDAILGPVCEDSDRAVYISKKRDSYMLGVFDTRQQTYHSSFKNVCYLLRQSSPLVVFVCILNLDGDPLTPDVIKSKQKLIRDTLEKKADTSFLNIGTVDWTSSLTSSLFSTFTFMSVYNLGTHVNGITIFLQNNILYPMEEASVKSFFPEHLPQVQVFLKCIRLLAKMAASLLFVFRKSKTCHNGINSFALIFCFMLAAIVLCLYPFFILQFLASSAIYTSVMGFFSSNIWTLLGIQLVNILYKSTVSGSEQESWSDWSSRFIRTCSTFLEMFTNFQVPSSLIGLLCDSLKVCGTFFAKFQFREGLLQLFSSLLSFISATTLMLDVRIFQECILHKFTTLISFLKNKVPESHFLRDQSTINRVTLFDKLKYLDTMYSIIETVYEILCSIVLSLLDRLCPTVGIVDDFTRDSKHLEFLRGIPPHPVVHFLTNGESNV